MRTTPRAYFDGSENQQERQKQSEDTQGEAQPDS